MGAVHVGTSKHGNIRRSNKDKKDIIHYCLECGKAVLEGNEEDKCLRCGNPPPHMGKITR